MLFLGMLLVKSKKIDMLSTLCGTEAGDQRGVNVSRSKFLPKFKPSVYIPKITQALKRSDQSLK